MVSSTEDGSGRGLTAAEVAELLGVKRQTVYAYVSRGILHRRMALDGRSSLFDRDEVDQLRLGRRPDAEGEMRLLLASRITRVADDGLLVRGHDLIDLVNGGTGFTEVADLLWESPPDETWSLEPRAAAQRPADPAAETLTLVDQLRVSLAIESSADPLRHDLSPKSVRAAGRRAIAAMANGVGRPVTPANGGPARPAHHRVGDLIWPRLTTRPGPAPRRRCLDVALALMADHGLASSTFAARIAASVRADPYSVAAAGIGALGGPLHGAASAEVHELFDEADRRGDAVAVVGDLQRRGRLPGFGHAVYRTQDPRYGALMAHVVDAWSGDRRLQTVFRVRDVVGERSDAIPNIDLALGAMTYLAGMSRHAGEAIFAIARTAGWLAHAMEEYDEKPLRFRPTARYIGRPPEEA